MEDKALAEKSRPRAGPGTALWPAFLGWGRGAPISHAWGWVPPGPLHSHASQGSWGLATCGHSPHVSVLDGLVVGGPGVSVVQHS